MMTGIRKKKYGYFLVLDDLVYTRYFLFNDIDFFDQVAISSLKLFLSLK